MPLLPQYKVIHAPPKVADSTVSLGNRDTRRETTVLLTLGRLPKALAMARSLAAAGCRVIVAEPFRMPICRLSRAVARTYRVTAPNRDLSRYQDELLDIIRHEQIDLVLPISEEAMYVVSMAPRLPLGVQVFSPCAATLMALHDKLAFARKAASFGLDVPDTYPLDDPAAERLSRTGPYVVKPTHSCSGIGLQLLERGAPLPAPTRPGDHVAQRFVSGDHVSTFSIAREGEIRATVIYRGKVITRTSAVCFERVRQLPCVAEWVERFVRQADYSGFISFDFIVEGGRAWAIECNPRLTSGMHFLEGEYVAGQVLRPFEAPPATFSAHDLQQQFYTTLAKTCSSLLHPRRLAMYLSHLLRARDVMWSVRDPLPFLLSMPACYEVLGQTWFGGRTFGEAVTDDIAWFGEGDFDALRQMEGGEREVVTEVPVLQQRDAS
ncbi:MAG: ATP-grasp domain-containing protein [Pseudomonadota bacterium]